jgi:TolB-like protein/Tfp pilus assembly protein PilF
MAIDSVAVLPFSNLSGDEGQEYFSDGMTEALINELGQIGALRVISRTSVMQFKNTDKALPEIARELDVDAVVEASVLRSGERVRITAQLIRANPEHQMWAESYERDARDVLSLHSEVARVIAGEIQVTLTPEEQTRLDNVRPVDPKAYDLYLKGRHHYNKSWTSREQFEKAARYFQQAVEIDPSYARAYDGLADSYIWLGYLGGLSQTEARSRAEPPLRRALEIDPELPDAHETLAGIKHYYDWEWIEAIEAYRRALALAPNLVEARFEYALLLSSLGRFEEAISEAKRAVHLDPLSYPANRALGDVYYHARQYDRAIEQYQQMIELDLNKAESYWMMAATYAQSGKYEDAVRANSEAMTLMGTPPEKIAALDSACAAFGPRGFWMWKLGRLEGRYDRKPYSAAQYFAQLGDTNQAFAWLEKAFEQHAPMEILKVDPRLDPLRDDPRFENLLRRMNLLDNETQQ